MAQAVSGNGSAKLHLLSAWWLFLLFLLLLPLLFTRSAYERGNSLGAQSQPGSHGGV